MAGTYVALLYSIGIGEGRRLLMADWRALLEGLPLQNVRTLIATGNAVFQCPPAPIGKLEARLEDAFDLRFGRRVDTIVRSAATFRRLAAANPFPRQSQRDGSRVVVRIMRKPLDREAVTALKPYLTQGERLKVVQGDLWVCFKTEPNLSRLMPVLGSKHLGVGTVRNWNTVRRLSEMLDQR